MLCKVDNEEQITRICQHFNPHLFIYGDGTKDAVDNFVKMQMDLVSMCVGGTSKGAKFFEVSVSMTFFQAPAGSDG